MGSVSPVVTLRSKHPISKWRHNLQTLAFVNDKPTHSKRTHKKTQTFGLFKLICFVEYSTRNEEAQNHTNYISHSSLTLGMLCSWFCLWWAVSENNINPFTTKTYIFAELSLYNNFFSFFAGETISNRHGHMLLWSKLLRIQTLFTDLMKYVKESINCALVSKGCFCEKSCFYLYYAFVVCIARANSNSPCYTPYFLILIFHFFSPDCKYILKVIIPLIFYHYEPNISFSTKMPTNAVNGASLTHLLKKKNNNKETYFH